MKTPQELMDWERTLVAEATAATMNQEIKTRSGRAYNKALKQAARNLQIYVSSWGYLCCGF